MSLCFHVAMDHYCWGDSASLCSCYFYYSILSIVFLSSCHSWFITTLSFYCLRASDHCFFSRHVVGFVLFILEFSVHNKLVAYPMCYTFSLCKRKYWPTHSVMAISIGQILTPASSLLQPGSWVFETFWAYLTRNCGRDGLYENNKNS